jgi:hypothetical protein
MSICNGCPPFYMIKFPIGFQEIIYNAIRFKYVL